MQSTSPSLTSDREFIPWVQQQNISLAFTTYQTNWLAFIGVNPETGGIYAFQRQFNRAMGLYCTPDRLYLSSKYQLWQLDNVLQPGQFYQGRDRLFIPRIAYTTGDIDVHDVAVTETGELIFISTLLNCLATTSDRHSCKPLWKPPFISQIINEDRCHLNGLAMVDGQPGYVTACSRSDVVDGWRDRRKDGGVAIDIASNEIILTGLSMPHSPRFYQGKLWLLNSGTGEFGYVDLDLGKFEPITFCPGYARGLAFWQNYAIVGLSKPRSGDGTFSGLLLDDRLKEKDADARCGLLVIDLKTGTIVHWVRIEGTITELYDVGVLPGTQKPMALGFQTQEIEQLISLEPLSEINLVTGDKKGGDQKGDRASITKYTSKKNRISPKNRLKLSRFFLSFLSLKKLRLFYDLTYHPNFQLNLLSQWKFNIESESSLNHLLPENKPDISLLINQALTYHQQGQFAQAIPLYQHVLPAEPDNILVLTNYGKALQKVNCHQEAIDILRRAIKLNPNHAQLYFYLSQSLKVQGDIETAAECLQKAIQLQPDFWGAYNNLGTIFQQQGNLAEAAQCYAKALEYNPNFAQAHSNLASIWQLQGDLERAKAGLIRALQLEPNYVPALLNLAYIYKQQGPLPGAIDCYQQVLAQEPRPEAYYNLGEILDYQGNIAGALACYQKVQELDPKNYNIEGAIAFTRLKICDWEDYESRTAEFIHSVQKYLNQETAYSPSPLALSSFPVPLALHRQFAESLSRATVAKMAKIKAGCNFAYPPNTDKLKIGYISPDFREHAVGKILKDMFSYCDRTRFEVYAYSTVDYNDAITETIRNGCDYFVNISAMTAETAARKINADGIHILIDLAGRTIGNGEEILALQPAQIQAHFLGYPDTMGADFIQYAIADSKLITPEIAQTYTEEIIYLPHAFFSSPMEIFERMMTRAEFGIPEDAFVFCCFNSHYKITPDLFDLWMRILAQVSNSVLWLTGGSEILIANLRREAAKRGIDGNRLFFTEKLPNSEYLARYRLADLFLDTFIYNGGSTAISALYAGCPVLTRSGNTNASRMGASICAAAKLNSLICSSSQEYEKQAIYLANHPRSLGYYRRHLSKNRDQLPLFNVRGFVQTLENALWQMWETYTKAK